MAALLYGLVAWAMSGAVARLMVGAGLSLVVFSGLALGVEALLGQAATGFGGMPGDIVQIAKLSGVGVALSIIGSALLSRVALMTAANVLGVSKGV